MITQQSRQEVIARGARVRAGSLLDQAGLTLARADEEGQALGDLLPKGYVDELKAAMDTVTAALKDRTLEHEEAKEATHAHHDAFADAKVWRRTVAQRCALARRLGRAVPDGLVYVSQARSLLDLGVQVNGMVKLLEANRDAIPGAGVDELIARGAALATTLQSADAQKEMKRFDDLPKAVQEFYYQRGLLYIGLKAINDAGQALHAGDASAASHYNLGLLWRRAAPRKPAPEPEPQPVAAGT